MSAHFVTWYPPSGCLVPLNTEGPAPSPSSGPSPSSDSCSERGDTPELNTNLPPPSRGLVTVLGIISADELD